MGLTRCARTLAAVASLAAATAPAAYASDIGEGGGGLPVTLRAQVTTTHHDSGATDWPLIALGTGGAVVLVGAGVAGSRANSRRRTSAREVDPARVS
jgi:hypothetical protein